MKEQTAEGNCTTKITICIVRTNEYGVEIGCICYISGVNVYDMCDTASGKCSDGRPLGHSELSLA